MTLYGCVMLGITAVLFLALYNITYTRNELFNIGKTNSCKLSPTEWNNLKSSGLFTPRRGKRAGKRVNGKNGNAKVLLPNARSIRKGVKSDIIAEHITRNKFSLVFITETWFYDTGDELTIKEVTPPGYSFLHIPRDNRRGGGVAIIHANTLQVSLLPQKSHESFEVIDAVVDNRLYVSTVYRPELSRPIFLDEFSKHLDSIVTLNSDILITLVFAKSQPLVVLSKV